MVDIIVGAGEVGTGMGKIFEQAGNEVRYHDPYKEVFAETAEQTVLHLCFPYSDKFVEQAKEYIKHFDPVLTIIHSTVEPGTTEQIGDDVVVSFVRGRHKEGIEQTVAIHYKPLGCKNKDIAYKAAAHLIKAGFNVSEIYTNPRAVELQKLLDTTYYGVCIAYTKMAKELADKWGVEWEAIAEGNKEYNLGVLAVGHPEWVRPELEPMAGPIGGHCVVPNAKILMEKFPHKLLEAIIEAK